MMQQRFGVPGFLGIIILVVWAVGWVAFGLHDWPYHFLFPAFLLRTGYLDDAVDRPDGSDLGLVVRGGGSGRLRGEQRDSGYERKAPDSQGRHGKQSGHGGLLVSFELAPL